MSIENFPTLLITIIGVFAAFIVLGSYYIFVIKCCLNWHQSASRTRPRRRVHGTHNQPFPFHASEPDEPQGLDESTIKLIPSVAYQKPKEPGVFHVCAVCLTEFKEEEKTRVLPNCLHFFHVDCIDTWLHKNANCPLCRSPPITTDLASVAVDQGMDHVHPEVSNEVVINIREDSLVTSDSTSCDSTPVSGNKRSSRKWSCRGDESIELRREKLPAVIPIRRSFSVDSSADRWLSKEVQKLLQQNPLFHVTPLAGSSRTVPKINLPMDLQWILHASSS